MHLETMPGLLSLHMTCIWKFMEANLIQDSRLRIQLIFFTFCDILSIQICNYDLYL